MSRANTNTIVLQRTETTQQPEPVTEPRLRAVEAKTDTAPRADTAEPATARETASPAAPAKTAASQPRSLRKPIFFGIGAIALAAVAWFGYDYITVGRFMVSTDDAYVGAHMAIMSPKVPAYVAEVAISDNQSVKEGDTLVRLDDGDYRLALDQAKARLATQNAAIATYDAQIRAAEAISAQARAQLEAAKANVVKTGADYDRTSALAAKDYSTKASLDAALAARASARAQEKADDAAIQSADANVSLLHAQRDQATRVAKELQVAVDQAARDLSFTVIRAPFDGVIGNKSVQVGDYVTPGKRLAAVVPLDKVYVDANLKETQLAPVAVGQQAEVYVDALGGDPLKGTVASVAPASGSQFSLLPPENATGNFTKIVQRVPVRIVVPAAEAKGRLRPGLSVVVDIDTRTTPKAPAEQHAAK
jgi:membrane fusion protein (multidrug efflux system)